MWQWSFLFLSFSTRCRLANRTKFIHEFFLLHKHTHAQKIRRIHRRYQRFTRRNIRHTTNTRRCARCKKREEAKHRREGRRGRGGGGGSSTSSMWRNERTHMYADTLTFMLAYHTRDSLRVSKSRPVNLFLPEVILSPVHSNESFERTEFCEENFNFTEWVTRTFAWLILLTIFLRITRASVVVAGKFGAWQLIKEGVIYL